MTSEFMYEHKGEFQRSIYFLDAIDWLIGEHPAQIGPVIDTEGRTEGFELSDCLPTGDR